MSGRASFARSGGGNVSKSDRARSGDVQKMVVTPVPQPAVPSNIPGAAAQGVPPAEADQMSVFARSGNAALIPTVVAAQMGLTQYGPVVVSSVARSGGQVRLAPGQFRAWANPKDPTPQASSQPLSPEIPTKVV